MTLTKFIGIAIALTILILILRTVSKDYAVLGVVASSIFLTFLIVEMAFGVVEEVQEVFAKANIPSNLLGGCVKVIGLAYLTEFSANLTQDAGEKSIADKVRLFGKMSIFLST
ncbi:MAG: SpoIIIAC/SpoIIIAD family protein, partial [Clostridia bacterium]